MGVAFAVIAAIMSIAKANLDVTRTTAERISAYNYPVETHKVQTPQGYVLTMFRIPYSPRLQNQYKRRPVAFLQHGVLSSSDCWVLNGPNNALAYLFADAGYDVWLGNNRGNTYSRKNVYLPHTEKEFWNFSFNEIATDDMPAMIDYILKKTNQKALHYVGHSQGTTVFFVLMSLIPSYNAKIKTAHMLAPVAYMAHIESPFAKISEPLLGNPSLLSDLLGGHEFLPSTEWLALFESESCSNNSLLQPFCTNVLFLITGYDNKHLNYTLLPEVGATHPAGASTTQLIHYVQEYASGYFRKYDYGKRENFLKYGDSLPPRYLESNIVAPVRLYYGANDFFSSPIDVRRMIRLLPNVVYSYLVPIPEFNHLDFLWSIQVKSLLYDKIIRAANRFEKTGKQ